MISNCVETVSTFLKVDNASALDILAKKVLI